MPRRCMATCRNRSAPRRSSASRTARSGCWSRATSRRAASTFKACRMSSISTCRSMPKITSIASAAPAAPDAKAAPSPWRPPEDGRFVEAIQQLIGKPIPVSTFPASKAATFAEGEKHRVAAVAVAGRSQPWPKQQAARAAAAPSEEWPQRPREAAPHAAKPARELGEHHEPTRSSREPKEHRAPSASPPALRQRASGGRQGRASTRRSP